MGLDYDSEPRAIRVCLQFGNLGNQQKRIQQIVYSVTLQRRQLHRDHVTAVLLYEDVVVGQRRSCSVDVGSGQIGLVDGHDHRHVRGAGVVNCFAGLRHDSVIRRHDQYGDVGHLRAACPHGGKRLMAWRIDESQEIVILLDLVGPDGLGNPAGFGIDDRRAAYGIE